MPSLPTRSTLHIDRYLTNYSVAYVQSEENFIAQRATSVIPVRKQSDKYSVIERADFWRDCVEKRPLGGRPVNANYRVTEDSYIAEEYALEHAIDDRQRTNADEPLDLDRLAARLLTQKHMIKQDRVWASSFFATGVWSQDRDGVDSGSLTGDQFERWDRATSDPIGDIDDEKDRIAELTGMMPNVLVMGAAVRRALRKHPEIQNVMTDNETKLASNQRLAEIFEVERVLVPRSVYNTAAEGAALASSFIVNDKAALLAFIDPNPTVDSPTAMATFAWTGLIPGETNALGGVMQRGREDREHSDFFQMRMAWAMKVVAPDLATFFDAAVS